MSEKLRSVLTVLLVAILVGGVVAFTAPPPGTQTETFHGIWRDGFETAAFYEASSTSNLPDPDETPDGWLSFAEGAWPLGGRSPDDPEWEFTSALEDSLEDLAALYATACDRSRRASSRAGPSRWR